MRMRRKKNGESRLLACEAVLAKRPQAPMHTPVDFDTPGPLYLEVGAGKGGFALGMAMAHPEARYYAMERVRDCVVLAAEKVTEQIASCGAPRNLRFMVDGADALPLWFAPESVDRLFLNFSDPWTKNGYRKRRLTYRKYLAIYFTLLKEGGTLTFKTDNVSLFDFTLEELSFMGLPCEVMTRDLHASPYVQGNVMTEYESAFVARGVPICMVRVCKPAGYVPPTLIKDKADEGV